MRGSHTHGRGAKKKARGKGHRGGVGKSGSGKRGDQKKRLKKGVKYFGRDKTRKAGKEIEIKIINLQRIVDNINSFVKKGIAKGKEGNYEVDLKVYKIIGNSDVNLKLKINALSASKGAHAAVKKGGGEIFIQTKGGDKNAGRNSEVRMEKKEKKGEEKDRDKKEEK